MLDFIKNLFKKKKEILSYKVKIDEIEKWLDSNTSDIKEDVSDQIKTLFDEINEAVKKAKKDLNALNNAKLKNENIPEREKHIMQGNRETYITNVMRFLENLDTDDNSFKGAKMFSADFKEKITNLSKSTAKSYYVLQHFFANEARDVALDLKKIEKNVKKINELTTKGSLQQIDEIKSLIDELEEKRLLMKELKKQVDDERENLEKVEQQKSKLILKMDSLKQSSEFSAFGELLKKRKEIEERIKLHNDGLYQKFSVLEHAMKKYLRMTMHEKLLGSYLADAATGIEIDDELKIVEVLEKMKKEIEEGRIELKEKKKEKTIETINDINDDYLRKFLEMHEELKNQKKNIDLEMHKNNVMHNYSEIKYRIEHITYKEDKIKEKIEELEKQMQKISIEEAKQKIIEMIMDVLDVKLELVEEKKEKPEQEENPVNPEQSPKDE